MTNDIEVSPQENGEQQHTIPILEPFWVEDGGLNMAFPQIMQVEETFQSAMELRADELEASPETSFDLAHVPRFNRRAYDQHFDDPVDAMVWAAVHIVAHDPDISSRQRRVFELTFQASGRLASSREFSNLLADDVVATSHVYNAFHQNAQGLTAEVEGVTHTDPEARYLFFKLIAGTNKDMSRGDVTTSREVFTSMLVARDYQNAQSIASDLYKDFKDGSFDAYIAEDLCRYVLTQAEGSITDRSLRRIKEQITFLMKCIPELSTNEVSDLLLKTQSSWPTELRLAFGTVKQKLGAEYVASKQGTLRAMRGKYLPLNDHDDLQTFQEAFQKFTHEQLMMQAQAMNQAAAKSPAKRADPLHMIPKAEIMRARVAQKKRGKQQSEESNLRDAETNSEKLTLVCVDEDTGEIFDSESPEFTKLKNKYLERYNRNPKLIEDIKTILDYMKGFDFSKGPIRGVKHYENYVKVAGQNVKVWGFKPLDAAGLSTSTVEAKGIRVFFCRPAGAEGKLAIIKIVDRDQAVRYQRNALANNSSASSSS